MKKMAVSCVDTMMWALVGLVMTLGCVEGWVNDYDKSFSFNCPAGQFISSISSIHHNYYEDRLYEFGCSVVPAKGELSSCSWTDYVNAFDEALTFQCPKQGFINGISSYHDNYYEDRRFRFRCCESSGYVVVSCYLTSSWVNDFDGPIAFTVPTGKVLRGIFSVHDNYYEDRRHKFTICDLSKGS